MPLSAVLILLISQGEIPNHRPAITPQIAQGSVFKGTRAIPQGVRGYATLSSTWVIAKPLAEVMRSLKKEFPTEIKSAPAIGSPGLHIGFVKSDRGVSISTMPGDTTAIRHLPQSHNRFTTLVVGESALSEGPLPYTWPATAKFAPVKFPAPLPTLGQPQTWRFRVLHGVTHYSVTWVIPGDPLKISDQIQKRFPKWKRDRSSFRPSTDRLLATRSP